MGGISVCVSVVCEYVTVTYVIACFARAASLRERSGLPAPIDPKLEQNALNASETIESEEVKENVDSDKIDDVETEPVPIKPQIEQNEVANEKPTETKRKKETLVGKILGRKK